MTKRPSHLLPVLPRVPSLSQVRAHWAKKYRRKKVRHFVALSLVDQMWLPSRARARDCTYATCKRKCRDVRQTCIHWDGASAPSSFVLGRFKSAGQPVYACRDCLMQDTSLKRKMREILTAE